MKVHYNQKRIASTDRRFNEQISCVGKDPRLGKRRLRKKGNQRVIKMVFALSLVPLTALFCTGCIETKNDMHETPIEIVDEAPGPIKFEELSVVNPEPEVAETIKDMIKRIFPEDWQLATAIFTAESGLRAEAKGDTNTAYPSIGVAQIRMLPSRELNEQDLYDPLYNLNYARQLKDHSGWYPWSCYKNGSYKKYIN